MRTSVHSEVAQAIQRAAYPLEGGPSDFDPLIERIGNARFVLLGEATHGTHEFYKARAEITKRLVREKGFSVIAWEADWPDALRIHRYVQGRSNVATALEALEGFKRFPIWMWRNADILDLIGSLKTHNEHVSRGPKVGIYGLDLYSLHASMEAVIHYLEKNNPEAALEARKRYSCFEGFGDEPQSYGMTAALDRSLSCEQEVVDQLLDLRRRQSELLSNDGSHAADELFYAEQNALVAQNAEKYYRAMYQGRPNTWNLRDTDMVDTLDHLMEHLRKQGEKPKAVIWAHNSILGMPGDANVAPRRNQCGAVDTGTSRGGSCAGRILTHRGTVTAASEWGGVTERKRVRPGMEGSYEELFHEANPGNYMLIFNEDEDLSRQLNKSRIERAIGVIYLPESERYSHYFSAQIASQFDVVLHYDDLSCGTARPEFRMGRRRTSGNIPFRILNLKVGGKYVLEPPR